MTRINLSKKRKKGERERRRNNLKSYANRISFAMMSHGLPLQFPFFIVS